MARYPLREDAGTRPLIEAEKAYPALETLVLEARSEVLFGIRIFDPKTRLRSQAALDRGLSNWGELIADATQRGVRVCILLTDFEPIVANPLHQITWKSLSGFRESARSSGDLDNLHVIAALHEGEFGPVFRWALWPLLRSRTRRIVQQANDKDENKPLRHSPGLWRLLGRRNSTVAAGIDDPPRMWPATHHQKVAVADGSVAIIGGLDINERRYDDSDHDRIANETWHDVSVSTEGAAASDIRDHLAHCWNRDVPRFNARLTALGAPRDDLPSFVAPIDIFPVSQSSEGCENIPNNTVQLVRTRSRRSRSLFAVGPCPEICELEQAHIDQIKQAKHFLYLETQFLRSKAITEALVVAGQSNPDLHLIAVVPAAPEEVAFEDSQSINMRHGEWLQVKAFDAIFSTFGKRFAAFSLARTAKGHAVHETGDRAVVNGRQIIYVHAKVAIADASHAIVSSANLNGRSMRWDTEAGLVWQNARAVREFQQRLWHAHLRDSYDPNIESTGLGAFEMWQAAALKTENADTGPQIVPYPLERARAFARRMPLIPANMV